MERHTHSITLPLAQHVITAMQAAMNVLATGWHRVLLAWCKTELQSCCFIMHERDFKVIQLQVDACVYGTYSIGVECCPQLEHIPVVVLN